MKKCILALDQGTSSSRAIVYDEDFRILSTAQKEFTQIYKNNGWVEHDPNEIWESQLSVAKAAIKMAGEIEIVGIGITNQRETTIVWDKNTGEPVYHAIVWMCRRTSDYCSELIENGYADMIKEITGLIIDPYFSATKIHWILENVPGAKERAEKGELYFGTVDSWLLYKLTEGKVHATDYTNAARTMLFN
ncbi:MAG: glycerol kinase, partial [Christensenellaceae bacterium]|nr:glycerol kinase [Christensenellaceae bacterium]